MLMDIWLIPSIFPADSEELKSRFQCIKEILEKMGLPLLDDEIDEKISALPYFQ